MVLLHTSLVAHELRSVSTKAKVSTLNAFLSLAHQRLLVFVATNRNIVESHSFEIAKISHLNDINFRVCVCEKIDFISLCESVYV